MPKYKVGDIIFYEDDSLSNSIWAGMPNIDCIVLYKITDNTQGRYELTVLDSGDYFNNNYAVYARTEYMTHDALDNNVFYDYAFHPHSFAWTRSGMGDPNTVGNAPDILKKSCTCDKYNVIYFGCKCGGI